MTKTRCAYSPGCGNECPKNQKYCCKEHAPYGYMSKENYAAPRRNRHSIYRKNVEESKPKQEVRMYSRKPKVQDFDGKEEDE